MAPDEDDYKKTGTGDEILMWNKNNAVDTGSRQSPTSQMVD